MTVPGSRAPRGTELPEKASSPLVVLPKKAHLQRTRSAKSLQRVAERGAPRAFDIVIRHRIQRSYREMLADVLDDELRKAIDTLLSGPVSS